MESASRCLPDADERGGNEMAPKIVMVRHANADGTAAVDMLPAGFELVNAQPGTAEFRANMADVKYLIGFGDPSMDDSFLSRGAAIEAGAAVERRL